MSGGDRPVHVEGEPGLPEDVTTGLIHDTLAAHGLEHEVVQLGIHWATPNEIAALNHEFRSVTAPTDVLAFPVDGRDDVPEGIPRMLGDIFICTEYVMDQVERGEQMVDGDQTGADALRRCLVHGLLHLLGYDHEQTQSRMFALEAAILTGDRAGARALAGSVL